MWPALGWWLSSSATGPSTHCATPTSDPAPPPRSAPPALAPSTCRVGMGEKSEGRGEGAPSSRKEEGLEAPVVGRMFHIREFTAAAAHTKFLPPPKVIAHKSQARREQGKEGHSGRRADTAAEGRGQG
eukprot:23681-Rhodomonas_salina.4